MVAELPHWRTIATFSRGFASIPHIRSLLGCERLILSPGAGDVGAIDAVMGWGQKPTSHEGAAFARAHGLPYVRAEDGFLRSVGLGVNGEPPLSVVLDDAGIYYDARIPSRLERLCMEAPLDDPALLERSAAAIRAIRAHRLSKYNDSPPGPITLPESQRPRVLVVDQTYGDLSVSCGLADAGAFNRMLRCALDENPDAEVVVKTHPDVVTGLKSGYLQAPLADARVRLLAEAVNPIALLETVERVYAVTSQLGFEALMAGVPVSCFGVPFYAGWGLTDDRGAVRRRGRALTLEQLFAAAYILYPRYIDPDTGRPGTIEDVIEHLRRQREMFATNRGRIFCFGFSVWKRNHVRAYLRCPGNEIRFPLTVQHARWMGFDHTSKLLVWGQRESAGVRELARRHGVEIWRMEDGFLRSVGLGSDLVAPASLVVDKRGIYYDPSRPSELEHILQNATFTADELERASALRRVIVESRLSKYNVGEDLALDVPHGRRVLLVPGQVEDDASIRLGCKDVRTNLALIEDVRRRNPDGFIVFKPHPDVLSGNRRGQVVPDRALSLADHIETSASLPQCLAVADEVYTMTSLVGFEGLLRSLRVVVYGRPFYSGWGLTEDANPLARRSRRLTLDELVAGTLIRYPRYLNRRTGRFTTPEMIVRQLRQERDSSNDIKVGMWWPRRQLRKAAHALREVTRAR